MPSGLQVSGSARHPTTAGTQSLSRYDNDCLNKPNTEDANVCAVGDRESPVMKEQLVKKYPSVFMQKYIY